MAHVPTEAEIDAMSEEELDSYLAAASGKADDSDLPGSTEPDRAEAPAWLVATGASRSYGWLLIAGSLIGIAASWELMVSELKLLKEPLANLSCDVSPLVSCGASLDVWQGNLLGVPNSFIGGMAFAVLLLVGALLVSGGRLPRWMWWGVTAGTVGGIGFVVWFLIVSITVFGKLCPFCMLIWAVTLPVAAHTWGQAALGGHLGLPRTEAERLHKARWPIAAAMYLAVAVTVLVAFWDGWVAMLS